jgi:hypothetical protein
MKKKAHEYDYQWLRTGTALNPHGHTPCYPDSLGVLIDTFRGDFNPINYQFGAWKLVYVGF